MQIDFENPYWEKRAAALPKAERQRIYKEAAKKSALEAVELARKGYVVNLEDKINECREYAARCGMLKEVKELERLCYAEILNQELEKAEACLNSLNKSGPEFRSALSSALEYAAKAKEKKKAKEKVKELYKEAAKRRAADAKGYVSAGKAYIVPIVLEDVRRYAKAAGIAFPKFECAKKAGDVFDKDFLLEKRNQLAQRLYDIQERWLASNYFMLSVCTTPLIGGLLGYAVGSPLVFAAIAGIFFAGLVSGIVWKVLEGNAYDRTKKELSRIEKLVKQK